MKICKIRKNFALISVIIATFIVSIVIVTVYKMNAYTLDSNTKNTKARMSYICAQNITERMLSKNFKYINTLNLRPVESFDSDFLTFNYPKDNFSYEVIVQYCTKADGTPDVFMKKITVNVYYSDDKLSSSSGRDLSSKLQEGCASIVSYKANRIMY